MRLTLSMCFSTEAVARAEGANDGMAKQGRRETSEEREPKRKTKKKTRKKKSGSVAARLKIEKRGYQGKSSQKVWKTVALMKKEEEVGGRRKSFYTYSPS